MRMIRFTLRIFKMKKEGKRGDDGSPEIRWVKVIPDERLKQRAGSNVTSTRRTQKCLFSLQWKTIKVKKITDVINPQIFYQMWMLASLQWELCLGGFMKSVSHRSDSNKKNWYLNDTDHLFEYYLFRQPNKTSKEGRKCWKLEVFCL